MDEMDLVLHGVAIKKHAAPEEIAGLLGLAPEVVNAQLMRACADGRLRDTGGRYALSPLARVALEAGYSRTFAEARTNDEFMKAYEAFELINLELKSIITEWQTINIGGQPVPNDHSDAEHDNKVIDRLGDCHERAEEIFRRLEDAMPRLSIYRHKLLQALEKAEAGSLEWVSDARIESYHTLWFELHEDLLRIVGRARRE